MFAEDFASSLSTVDDISQANKKLEEYISCHNDVLNQHDKRILKKKLKKKIKKAKKQNPGLVLDKGKDDASSDNEGNIKETVESTKGIQFKKSSKPLEAQPDEPQRPLEVFDDPFE